MNFFFRLKEIIELGSSKYPFFISTNAISLTLAVSLKDLFSFSSSLIAFFKVGIIK
ncbi:hypothetical protein OAL80_04375 [Pelagibacteraceae bacterium]|jgi:hypothetical protein|nr:hypothetical protein [Pelagibacteraceae bacterium]